MDVRKHMLAYFERTILSSNQSPKDLPAALKQLSTHKVTDKTSRNSPTPVKFNSDSFTCKSEAIHRSLSSKVNSNRSSRISSPVPQGRFQKSVFREAVLRTINELIKLRKLKMTKHLEMVSKEIKLVQKLKVLVLDEIVLCRKQEERRVVQDVNERLSVIMKESAEELLVIEQKVKAVVQENLALQEKIERMFSLKRKQGGVEVSVEDCLNELTDKASDVSTMLVSEPVIVDGYLEKIGDIAERVIREIGFKDLNLLPGVLALYLSREKMLFEQRKKQNCEQVMRLGKRKKKLMKSLELMQGF